MCNLGFHEMLEGLLGEGNYKPELLFILREPHCDNQTEFWFREYVVKKAYSELKRAEKRYFNILLALSQKVFATGEDDEFALKRCAYMNLYPFHGGKNRSEEYKSILKAMDAMKNVSLGECASAIIDIDKNCTADVIAKHRIGIIQRAIDNGVKNIITTEDIYDVIKNIWNVRDQDQKDYSLKYNYNNGERNKTFHVCSLGENNETRLISFWHPSCTLINMGNLNSNELQIP